MARFELLKHHQFFSLVLSTILAFTLSSSVWAKKDYPEESHTLRTRTTVVEVPVVMTPGKTNKKDKNPKTYKSYKKGYIPSRSHVNQMSTKAQKQTHKRRNYNNNKNWKQWNRVYGRSPWENRNRPRYGSRHRSLPTNYLSISIGSVPFFYSAGVYFQRSNQGYVVVQPPLGGRVQILPEGCSSFYYGDRRCYSCDNVFYEEVGTEYMVINQPSSYRIIADAGDEVEIDTSSLNLRTGPGLKYDTLTTLRQGEIAEVDAVDGDWYYVGLENGSYGWIKRQYTKIISFKEDPKG